MTLERYHAEERQMAMVEARRGFTIHAAITVVVVVGLAIGNVFVASELPWAVFPAVGMSLGVLAHWLFGVRRGDEFRRQHHEQVERQARLAASRAEFAYPAEVVGPI